MDDQPFHIDTSRGLRPNRRKSLTDGEIATGISIVLIALGAAAFLGAVVFISVDRSRKPTATQPLPPRLTYAKFMQVQVGMSKGDVFDILGLDCELLSENELGQGTGFHVRTEMYMWKDGGFSGGNCNVLIQNDKVVSKAQFGLK